MDTIQSNIEFNYGILPKNVMKSSLSIKSKAVYAYLCVYAGNKGCAFPSASLIQHELRISKDVFYKCMAELKQTGYVTVEKKKNDFKQFENNIYFLNSKPCPSFPDTAEPDTEKPDTEKQDTNNNSFNNNNINNNNIKYTPDSNEYRLALYLFKYIQSNNSKAKKPDFQKWAKTFDLILRVDNQTLEEVKKVIEWCQKDDFWYKNILSPTNLRKNFDRLFLSMSGSKSKTNSQINQPKSNASAYKVIE